MLYFSGNPAEVNRLDSHVDDVDAKHHEKTRAVHIRLIDERIGQDADNTHKKPQHRRAVNSLHKHLRPLVGPPPEHEPANKRQPEHQEVGDHQSRKIVSRIGIAKKLKKYSQPYGNNKEDNGKSKIHELGLLSVRMSCQRE